MATGLLLRFLATSRSVTSVLSCVAVVKRLKLLEQQHREYSGTALVWHCWVGIGRCAAPLCPRDCTRRCVLLWIHKSPCLV